MTIPARASGTFPPAAGVLSWPCTSSCCVWCGIWSLLHACLTVWPVEGGVEERTGFGHLVTRGGWGGRVCWLWPPCSCHVLTTLPLTCLHWPWGSTWKMYLCPEGENWGPQMEDCQREWAARVFQLPQVYILIPELFWNLETVYIFFSYCLAYLQNEGIILNRPNLISHL